MIRAVPVPHKTLTVGPEVIHRVVLQHEPVPELVTGYRPYVIGYEIALAKAGGDTGFF